MSTSFSEHYSLLTSQLPPTDPKKSNKISDVVKLKRMLKKWRKQANSTIPSTTTITASSAPTTPTHHHSSKSKHMGRTTTSKNIQISTNNNNLISTRSTPSSIKGIKFLKRTLSFPDRLSTTAAGSSSQTITTSSSSSNVSKGYLAVDVGEEMKRFTIPMSYLGHEDFVILLKEAEEEFGFQQEGVLRIPCEVEIFEMILKGLEQQTKNNKVMLTTTSRRRNGNHHGCGTIDQSHQILTTKTTPYHRHQYHPASPIYRPASPMCR